MDVEVVVTMERRPVDVRYVDRDDGQCIQGKGDRR